MALYNRLEVEYINEDERGRLLQLIHDGYKQVNVLETKKGVVRGEHYHKKCSEAFFVLSGRVEVRLERDNTSEKTIFETMDFFMIEPHTIHTMYFLEDTLMIQMYDNAVVLDDGTKDIYQV